MIAGCANVKGMKLILGPLNIVKTTSTDANDRQALLRANFFS